MVSEYSLVSIHVMAANCSPLNFSAQHVGRSTFRTDRNVNVFSVAFGLTSLPPLNQLFHYKIT